MNEQYSKSERLKAWAVHLFTATGIIAVFLAIVATGESDFRAAMLWLILALIIDGVDGTLARRYHVEEVLPEMSGKSIDFVIDFAGYAIVPAYMIYQADLMPLQLSLLMTFLILTTSAIYYGKEGMISDNHYFVGFPVMWNMVAFYLIFIFDWPATAYAIAIVVLAALQFAPIKVPYPSRTKRWQAANIIFTVIFLLSVSGALIYYPQENVVTYWGCVLSLAYFTLFTLVATFIYRD